MVFEEKARHISMLTHLIYVVLLQVDLRVFYHYFSKVYNRSKKGRDRILSKTNLLGSNFGKTYTTCFFTKGKICSTMNMNNANFDKDLKNTTSYDMLKDITPTSVNKGMQRNCSADIKVCCLLYEY